MGVGVTLTAFGSMFVKDTPAIPYKLIPDLRIALLMAAGTSLGLYAAYGKSGHRTWALWGVLAFVIGFHLEEALVHWIGPFPGSITGTPVGVLGTAGSILAVGSVVLLHVEVESSRLALDLDRRGAGREAGLAVAEGLRNEGLRRVLAVALGAAGLGALAVVAEKLMGHDATGGIWVLFVGSAVLFGLALFIVRVGRAAR